MMFTRRTLYVQPERQAARLVLALHGLLHIQDIGGDSGNVETSIQLFVCCVVVGTTR